MTYELCFSIVVTLSINLLVSRWYHKDGWICGQLAVRDAVAEGRRKALQKRQLRPDDQWLAGYAEGLRDVQQAIEEKYQ